MGVKRNFLYSAVLTVSNYVFPFIIYPYVSRVLGVENIGICNYVDSIINYASVFALMGVAVAGTREIARAAGDSEQLYRVFTAFFVLCAGMTLIATGALLWATFTVEKMAPYKPLLLIGLAKLWGNFLLLEWFFRGIEDFRYITVRTIAVKMGYLVAVFALIHVASDYAVYFLLICLMVAVNAAFNCVRAATVVRFRWDAVVVRRCAIPFFIFGAYCVLTSLYTTFNVMYLGYEQGDVEVGYYTTSTKIFQIVLALYTAYSTVVMPRASALLSQGRKDEFHELIRKSIYGLLAFAVPAAIFLMIFSRGVVYLIAGDGYEGAELPMTIMMPLIFIIGYEQILVIQVLMPLGSDKATLLNSGIGASISLVLNYLLIHVMMMGAVGSSIVWVCSEVVVLLLSQWFVTRYTRQRFPVGLFVRNVVSYLPYVVAALAISYALSARSIYAMAAGGVLLVAYAVVVQVYVLKNPLIAEQIGVITNKLRGR